MTSPSNQPTEEPKETESDDIDREDLARRVQAVINEYLNGTAIYLPHEAITNRDEIYIILSDILSIIFIIHLPNIHSGINQGKICEAN